MACGGELPLNWWHDKDTFVAELEAHETMVAMGQAHGVAVTTLKGWRAKHGLPKQPSSQASIASAEVGEEIDEAEILRRRVRELERHLRREREGEIIEERLLQRLEEAIEKQEPRYSPLVISRNGSKSEPQEMALLFSDTHASEQVSLEETEGLNAYDWPTMLDRMRVLQTAVLSHKEHLGFPVETLNVWLLGDLLSGDIHDELAITNDRPTAEAAVDFAYDTAAWLEEFVPHFKKIKVRGVPGNHPRATKKPSNKQVHNNADWLMYRMVELYHRGNPAFDFKFKRGAYQEVMVADRWRVLLMHGDGIRTTMPGVPWGGVVRRITTLEQQFSKAKRPLDYFCLGHFHTANTLDGVQARTFLNGSVKGLDEFSLKNFGSGRDACQILLTFHNEHGWSGTYPLDLQGTVPASEGWEVAA